MTADGINGCFEFGGGLLLLLNCRRLYRDKAVKGISLWPVTLFTLWGYWNLYFYPAVGAWWSFYAGLLVVAANTTWLGMALYYRRTR